MGYSFVSHGGAARVSSLIVDADLDMSGFRISGVPDLAIPYRPETWQTVEFGEWDDIPPETTYRGDGPRSPYDGYASMTVFTNTGVGRWYTVTFTGAGPYSYAGVCGQILIDGNTVTSYHVAPGVVYTSPPFIVGAGKSVVLRYTCCDSRYRAQAMAVEYTNTGIYADGKTFLLTDEWLAMNCDTKGLPITVKINGVNIPIEEYNTHAIPVAPTEVIIPGNWGFFQERPILRKFVLPPGT